MKRTRLVFTTTLGLMLGLTLTFGLGYFRQVEAAPSYEYLDTFTKVMHFVQANYVEEVETEKLMEGAIKGMLSTLDPHTVYLPPDQFKEMQVDTSGRFGGLGIEITIQDGILTVVTPIEDTPAFQEGVEPGDKIIRIVDKRDKVDKETKGMSLHEAVKLMRGKKGTPVTIHVVRKGLNKPKPITITRDIIRVNSVKSGIIEPGYGWLRITSFQANTTRDLRAHLQKMIKENQAKNKGDLEGLVLDLRYNPGGLLEEAVSVSGTFLGNVPIVSTMGRNKKQKEVEYGKMKNPYDKLKLVVLVNEASASASEIVAGALQDHKRGLIVGKTTFGKGSVQTVIDLDNKSGARAGLKLTVARYYTPNGRSIQGKGITPDIEVDRIDVDLLEKAKQGRMLREADLKGHIIGEDEDTSAESKDEDEAEKKDRSDIRPIREKDGKKIRVSDPAVLVKSDFQLQQALAYLKAWNIFRTAGNWEPEKKTAASAK
ncbi:MAG: S41 family peptidase [Bdellovibrionaceae bacterium]|nr:S41 family peptidase [Pseudobdellovibrionaceae bacterium]